MKDADIVAYLLKNHYWHILISCRNDGAGWHTNYFTLAGFRLSQDFSMSEYGGHWKDSYTSHTDYMLRDIKSKRWVHISQKDGEKLYYRLKQQYKTRHTRRIILLMLLTIVGIWAGRSIYKDKDTDTNTSAPTSNTAQAITSSPCDEMNTFYYYENGRQH